MVGALSGLRPGRRAALLVGLLVFGVLLAGAALIGIEWRYRFPLDPLINVLAAGGLVTLLGLVPGLCTPLDGLARRSAGHDAGGADLVRRRPSVWYDIRADVMPLLLLVFGAIVLRVAFFTSAPPFLNPDSAGYYVPGRNLVYGDGFDLGLRRTPTYPLFIAAVVAYVGEDLQALVTVQHFLFGPLLVALTYLLGRLVTSRLAAIVAAALVGDLRPAAALRALRHDRGAVRHPAAGAALRDRPGRRDGPASSGRAWRACCSGRWCSAARPGRSWRRLSAGRCCS